MNLPTSGRLQSLILQDDCPVLREQIDSYSASVARACRDKYALQDARDLVPIAQIVQENLEILDGDYQDNLLPHLVQWFSNDFFSWFKPPNCEKCQSPLESVSQLVNPEGRLVESYSCSTLCCDYKYDFIRHNDPAILLRTRQGRCGEWANCFMIFLQAFDYQARLILDTTDHVWNEVWSENQQRWIHVDPCESVLDTPLLYEIGWNKQLKYCLAFGQYEALDVTRRYVVDFEQTKTRRQVRSEDWLERYMEDVTNELARHLSAEERSIILNRRSIDKNHLEELVFKPRQLPDKASLKGRKTGSIQWRIQRGEYNPILKNNHIIKVISVKAEEEYLFNLSYNSIKNAYQSSVEDYQRKDWSSLVYLSENLDYKYERDWKTSYIARYETCPYDSLGKIIWRFDLSSLVTWSRLELLVKSQIYPGTEVDLVLLIYFHDDCDKAKDEIQLKVNSTNTIDVHRFKDKVKMIDLIVKLHGGIANDEVAWQKPQLFRQTKGVNDDEWPFFMKIY